MKTRLLIIIGILSVSVLLYFLFYAGIISGSCLEGKNWYGACKGAPVQPETIGTGLGSSVFMSQTVNEWKSKTSQDLKSYYKKYKDDFYIELGRFLIKDEMEKNLASNGIINKHDNFEVFSGMMLTSLPPHISYTAVVNATDGNSYYLEGGVFANKIEHIQINKLVLYDDVLSAKKDPNREFPYQELFQAEPRVTISSQEGNKGLVEPYSMVLDLRQNSKVTFYNNLTAPIRIQEYGSGFIEDEGKISWKSTIIEPHQIAVVQFNETGNYQWQARTPPKESEQWSEYMGGGEIAIISDETKNLPLEKRMDIARTILHNARPDVPWSGMGSTNNGVEIWLSDAILSMLPDAQRYYEARAHEWVPFDVPIIIEAPKTLEVPKLLE